MFYLGLVVLGLIIGSFLGAFTFRKPRAISIMWGRSFCPKCKREIAWYDNIPVLSFLILGGRCRQCHKQISIRYPLIELSGVLAFVASGFVAKDPVSLVFLLFISSLLIFIFVVDLETRIIPDEAVFWGFLVVVLYCLFIIPYSLFPNLAGGFIAALFLLGIHLITRGRGMGLGDVKFALLGGTLVGLKLIAVWLLLAFLTGAIFGVILILAGRAKLKSAIAFGPFLIFALIPTFLWGTRIFNFLMW